MGLGRKRQRPGYAHQRKGRLAMAFFRNNPARLLMYRAPPARVVCRTLNALRRDPLSSTSLVRVGRQIEAAAGATLAAKAIERALPLGLEVRIEHEGGVGIDHQPGVVLHLAVELARRPAGMTQRQPGLLGATATRHVLQDLERGRERHAALDHQRLVALVVGRMQDQAARGLDRAAEQHWRLGGHGRHVDAELLVDLAQRQVVDLVVHDDAQRALVVMLADKDDALLEALIRHGWRCDQEAADQIRGGQIGGGGRSEEHTSELQSLRHLVCRLLLEKKKKKINKPTQVKKKKKKKTIIQK